MVHVQDMIYCMSLVAKNILKMLDKILLGLCLLTLSIPICGYLRIYGSMFVQVPLCYVGLKLRLYVFVDALVH